MNRLIALHSSVPQSGKSTVASILFQNHAFYTVPLALPIKRMVKTFLKEAGLELADTLGFDIDQYKTHTLSELLPEYRQCNVTVRRLMQTLGTEWGREHVHPDIWIQMWAQCAKRYMDRGVGVCVDDLRFANEALTIRNMGGEIWKVIRPEHQVDDTVLNHASEYGLDEKIFDRVIVNDGTIEDLEKKIAAVCEPIKVYF